MICNIRQFSSDARAWILRNSFLTDPMSALVWTRGIWVSERAKKMETDEMIYFAFAYARKISPNKLQNMKEINYVRNIMFLFNDVWHSMRVDVIWWFFARTIWLH